MRIYYTGVDQGDGSLSVEFYDSQEAIDYLESEVPEYYRGEGGGYFDCDNFSDFVYSLDDAIKSVKEYRGET